jgi:hypothetical protein
MKGVLAKFENLTVNFHPKNSIKRKMWFKIVQIWTTEVKNNKILNRVDKMEFNTTLQKFDTSDLLTTSGRWVKWIRAFELRAVPDGQQSDRPGPEKGKSATPRWNRSSRYFL